MPKLPEHVEALFARYGVEASGECILLGAALDSHGYTIVHINGVRWSGHRYVAEHTLGPVAGHVVMHDCDTPRCVNPRHLRIGTQKQNIQDRVQKGRNGACRGESAPWAKLNAEQVNKVRRQFAAKRPRAEIMADFGISRTQLYRIANGESWRHTQ